MTMFVWNHGDSTSDAVFDKQMHIGVGEEL